MPSSSRARRRISPVGVRLKFANVTTVTGTNTGSRQDLVLKVYGSTSGATSVFFNLYNCTNSTSPFQSGVRWDGRGGTVVRQLVGETSAVMKTEYFWVFLTGTPGGAITCRSFDTDDATLTASSTYSVNMPALSGNLRVQFLCSFGLTPTNTATVDKVWYKPSVDLAVTPASTA